MAATISHFLPHIHRSRSSSLKSASFSKDGGKPRKGEDEEQYCARRREEEKRMLADWEAEKRPLEPAEIAVDPSKKVVGHSSKHLRCEDFQLLKTLGTGRT
jgi:protein kinase A